MIFGYRLLKMEVKYIVYQKFYLNIVLEKIQGQQKLNMTKLL